VRAVHRVVAQAAPPPQLEPRERFMGVVVGVDFKT